jgi:DNA-binding transcriptional MerR regulator
MSSRMMIGALGRRTSTKVTTIRFYEEIGLLEVPQRTQSGRRTYGLEDLERLRFIRNARRLGFGIPEVRSLIDLAERPDQECDAASEIAAQHLSDVEERLERLEALRTQLAGLIGHCSSESIAECQIIKALVGGEEKFC